MVDWLAKIADGTYGKCAAKSVKTPKTHEISSANHTAKTANTLTEFVQLVCSFAVFDHGLVLEPEQILAELDAADLEELERVDAFERKAWAELLAHRLSKLRLEKGPPRPKGDPQGAAGAT